MLQVDELNYSKYINQTQQDISLVHMIYLLMWNKKENIWQRGKK